MTNSSLRPAFPLNVQRRNELACECIDIEANLLPMCQNPERRGKYIDRLAAIENEIEQTYEDQPDSNGPAG